MTEETISPALEPVPAYLDMVEAGESRAPSYQNILYLVKERRALAIRFQA